MALTQLQDAHIYNGLSDQEVIQRITKFGLNELPASKPRSFFSISFEIFKEPMFILLVSCCALYLAVGDLQEALILSVFVIIIIGITLFQSWKTEKTLAALRDLTSPKSLVVRNGQEIYISTREIVVDDIVILNEGDKVSADAQILNAINLIVDESSLTGESVPVKKDNSNIVYSGTLVVGGTAYTKVIATGKNTELGKIGSTIQSITKDDSRFKKETSKMVNRIVIFAAIFCLIIIGSWLLRGDLIKGFLTSITFAIAMLPEEIPAVLTIFMALGAWRISQKNVLTRRMAAIETLGSVTVLCTDKTGTLTENKMALSEVYSSGSFYQINKEVVPDKYHSLIEFALLASKEESFDPMEKALMKIVSDKLIDSSHIHKNWGLAQEYPLSKELLAMSRAWIPSDKQEFLFYSKGSPEAIFDLCHLPSVEIQSLTSVVAEMASRGLRILGVAKSKSALSELPAKQHDIDFEFCGLLGFSDPVRTGVKEAIQDCYSAGIKVVMITGDYHVTAQSIAKGIGLKNTDNFMTGLELETLDDNELERRIQDISIFSRVIPTQKLRIVNALKKNQEVIAMTGDGVNDAAALRASDVGIAMGLAGTNVARESADLILLDDNFSSIVSAIRLGRRIFDNLRKSISYIVAIHIPIAGLTLIPVLFADLPVIFSPIHVAFLELVIDPTCSLVFEAEPESKGIMARAPRKISEPILSQKKLMISVAYGLLVLLLVLASYFFAIFSNKSDAEVRALSFGTLLIGNFFLVFVNKSWGSKPILDLLFENKALMIILLIVPAVFTFILCIPILRHLFYFG